MSWTNTFGTLVGLGFLIIILLGIVFAFWSGIIWVICWAFAIPFTFKYVFGAWAISVLFSMIFKGK